MDKNYIMPPINLMAVSSRQITSPSNISCKANEIVARMKTHNINLKALGVEVGSYIQYRFEVLSKFTKMTEFYNYEYEFQVILETGDVIIDTSSNDGILCVEVPNPQNVAVFLANMLTSSEFQNKKGRLLFPVGQDIFGKTAVADLATLPNLLVAGTTGSGKSVFLHSLIASLMFSHSPESVRFVLVDPKFVEFCCYDNSPHLLIKQALTFPAQVLSAMDYLVEELAVRYQKFRESGAVNIDDYNEKTDSSSKHKMPHLVVVVDELADIMLSCGKEFEEKFNRICQKSRAAGIHFVFATQRTDESVISDAIKHNVPARMLFKVPESADSKNLGVCGCEHLSRTGDVLFVTPARYGYERLQTPYISIREVEQIVHFIATNNIAEFDEELNSRILTASL